METSFSKTNPTAVVALLIVEVIAVTIPVLLLGKYFNFPAILRQPAEDAFVLFRSNQIPITIAYYLFLISSLLYIPLSYALKKMFYQLENRVIFQAFAGLGITTAIFQSIGFIRWIFTMSYLTDTYFAQPESKHTIALIYEMLNRYVGMSIGEHLGFLAMGSWTIILGSMLIQSVNGNKWLGYIGFFIGFLLVFSVGEHFGGRNAQFFGTINFMANSLWTLWLISLALLLFFVRKKNKMSLKSA